MISKPLRHFTLNDLYSSIEDLTINPSVVIDDDQCHRTITGSSCFFYLHLDQVLMNKTGNVLSDRTDDEI